ncbi:hypothetical protein MG293_019206 [Ovis ammon polii]|uniref:MACF1 factor n=1 Tax=Ovis ammon polii TaxID=230172 RepID=A0AAD4TNG1_OVIAM|nr:hypothetical protein MG293_019206 [Ovis ammon polii]
MIAAAFLVLLRPYSIQCALFLLLLLLGTIATIVFFCCWHRRLQKGRHPMKSVFSGRSRSRDAVLRSHHFRSEDKEPKVTSNAELLLVSVRCGPKAEQKRTGFRSSPRHLRRRAAAAARLEDVKPAAEAPAQSEQDGAARRRRLRRGARVPPEFYQSVQGAAARRPGVPWVSVSQTGHVERSFPVGHFCVVTLVTRGEPARSDVMVCPSNSVFRFSHVDGESTLTTDSSSGDRLRKVFSDPSHESAVLCPDVEQSSHSGCCKNALSIMCQSSGNASYRCSMSSSADFSDEDDFSQKSGSASPAPGDTLPWNLPKHERSKRKIHGGSVLDPAERAVLRIAGIVAMGIKVVNAKHFADSLTHGKRSVSEG